MSDSAPVAAEFDAQRCLEILRCLGEEGAERELLRRTLGWIAESTGPVGLFVRTAVGSWERVAASPEDVLPAALAPDAPLRFDPLGHGFALVSEPHAPQPSATGLALAALVVRVDTLARRLKHEDFLSRYRGVEIEALYDVGLAITRTLDLDRLGEEILLHAVSLLDARRGALYALDSGGGYRLTRSIGGDAVDTIEPGAPVMASRVMPGAEHLLSTPIEIDGVQRGLLLVADKESRVGVGAFGDKDQRTLALFANQAAIALETARLHRDALEKERLEREMELASRIQQEILPDQLPSPPGWSLLGWSRPARHVGGDYYDAIDVGAGRLLLVLGDVTGKGMPAALLVSTLHSALRLLCDRDLELGGMLARLNTHIGESSASNKFITLFLAELELGTGILRWSNAGHNPPVLLRRDGQVDLLPASGIPLGLMPFGSWEPRETRLEPGDLLCVYSDGITEAASPSEEELGLDRLVTLLGAAATAPLEEVRQAIDTTVADFVGDQPAADDQTVLLLRRT